MGKQLADLHEPICICGHPASQHYTEEETAYFNGIFNPALAGKVETYFWMTCAGFNGNHPCVSIEHEWTV